MGGKEVLVGERDTQASRTERRSQTLGHGSFASFNITGKRIIASGGWITGWGVGPRCRADASRAQRRKPACQVDALSRNPLLSQRLPVTRRGDRRIRSDRASALGNLGRDGRADSGGIRTRQRSAAGTSGRQSQAEGENVNGPENSHMRLLWVS